MRTAQENFHCTDTISIHITKGLMRILLPWILGKLGNAYVQVDDVEAHFQLGKARKVTAKDAILQKILHELPNRMEEQMETHGSAREAVPPGMEHFDTNIVSLLEKEVRLRDHAMDLQEHLGHAMEGVFSGIQNGETMEEVMAKAKKHLATSGLFNKAQGWISNETKTKISQACYPRENGTIYKCPDSIRFGIYTAFNLRKIFWRKKTDPPDLMFAEGVLEDHKYDFFDRAKYDESLFKRRLGKAWDGVTSPLVWLWDKTVIPKTILNRIRYPTFSLFGAWSWKDNKFHLCLKYGVAEYNTRADFDPNLENNGMVMLGTFAGFSNSKSFGGWGGGVNAQWWKWASNGKKTNLDSKWAKKSLGFDWRYKKWGTDPVADTNPSSPGGWASVDVRYCWVDASGCKTSDEAYYTHPKYLEQVRSLTAPQPWENAVVRKQNREDGYNALIHAEESPSTSTLQRYLMEERTTNEFLHGGFFKYPNRTEWNLGLRGLLRPGAYLFGGDMYKVEFAITPVTYELCTVDDAYDFMDFSTYNDVKAPVTTTTTTTITETTTITTTLFPTTSVTTTTSTITPWYGAYAPKGDLSQYANKTIAPGRSLEWVARNAPSWHPAPEKYRYANTSDEVASRIAAGETPPPR